MSHAYQFTNLPRATWRSNALLLPAITAAITGCLSGLLAATVSAQSVVGDTGCAYGTPDCNPCVNNVQDAFQRISGSPTAQIRYKSGGGETLPPLNSRLETFEGNSTHVQGIVRLSGLGDYAANALGPWFALTRANPGHPGGSGLFVVQLQDLPANSGFPINTTARGEPPVARGTKAYFPILGLDHAGGLQAIGQHVAIASSCDQCSGNGFLHTYNLADPLSPNAWETAMRLGDQGEPGNVQVVTSAAIVKLASGQFLVFVLGKDSTHEGWFYVSEGTVLSGDTRWIYAGYWQSNLGGANEYQNTQLITECGTGDLYMVGSGNSDYDGTLDDVTQTVLGVTPGSNHLSLLKLSPSDSSFANMDVVAVRVFHPGDGDYCTFRAGASVHVTPDNSLVVYCSTRKANTNFWGDPDSKLKMEEYAPN
jgi:hypothetical protein